MHRIKNEQNIDLKIATKKKDQQILHPAKWFTVRNEALRRTSIQT